jgi:uncharacterized protein YggE
MMRIVLLLALPALAACGQSAPDPRGVDRDETLLTVSATGRAETRPDEASITLGVNSLGASAAEASRLNNEKMTKVAAALASFGVKPDDMQTSNLGLNRIDYGKDRGRFSASNNVTIRLRDMARVGEAVAAATDSGANLVAGPRLRVTDSEGAAMSAYANAYQAARLRADAYAKAAGLKVDRVLVIRDGGQSGGEPIPMAEEAMAVQRMAPPTISPPPPPPFSPGVNASIVSVRVDFALSD